MLVHLERSSPEDATWEYFSLLKMQYRLLDLEDKVFFNRRGNITCPCKVAWRNDYEDDSFKGQVVVHMDGSQMGHEIVKECESNAWHDDEEIVTGGQIDRGYQGPITTQRRAYGEMCE